MSRPTRDLRIIGVCRLISPAIPIDEVAAQAGSGSWHIIGVMIESHVVVGRQARAESGR